MVDLQRSGLLEQELVLSLAQAEELAMMFFRNCDSKRRARGRLAVLEEDDGKGLAKIEDRVMDGGLQRVVRFRSHREVTREATAGWDPDQNISSLRGWYAQARAAFGNGYESNRQWTVELEEEGIIDRRELPDLGRVVVVLDEDRLSEAWPELEDWHLTELVDEAAEDR